MGVCKKLFRIAWENWLLVFNQFSKQTKFVTNICIGISIFFLNVDNNVSQLVTT